VTAAFEVIDGIPTYNLYIGGQWTRASRNEATTSYNPATGEPYARVHQAGVAETERALTAAHEAYKAWADMVVSEREAVFLRAADVLGSKAKEITDVLIEESGSVAGKAGFEVGYCFDLLRTAAAEMRRSPGETMPTTLPGQFGFTVRRPLGVIAGIAPFNAPFLLAMKKVVMALAAGNGFVLKPSELTPVTGLKIAEVFDEARLPPGLLSVIPGPASEVGQALFADPRVRMITFTGSTQTGRHLAVEAAKTLKRFTLEMGGKSPLIVLADADINYAVRAAAFGIFFHQGQVCMANSRILMEAPIYDAFCVRCRGQQSQGRRSPRARYGDRAADPRQPMRRHRRSRRGCRRQGSHGDVRRQARKAILLADGTEGRDARHAHLPRGELRSDHLDHQGRRSRGSTQDRQRHFLRSLLGGDHQRHAESARSRFRARRWHGPHQ
jgi:vanillin dehydrogenase